MIEDEAIAAPRQSLVEVRRAGGRDAGGGIAHGLAGREHHRGRLTVRIGDAHGDLMLDDDDLDQVGEAIDRELRAEGSCRAGSRGDHEGARLRVGAGRRGEVGDTGQQIDPPLLVVEAQGDGARRPELDAAAVGQGEGPPLGGRGEVVGGNHREADRPIHRSAPAVSSISAGGECGEKAPTATRQP